MSLEDHRMYKISLIIFLLLFPFLAQSSSSTFGQNCTNPNLNKQLKEELGFPKICHVWVCPGDYLEGWEGYGLPWEDDKLAKKGWTPQQVALAALTFNINNIFTNADEDKREEGLYKDIIEELAERSPFRNTNEMWNFIKTMTESSEDKAQRLSHITEDRLKNQFQEICKPKTEEAPEPTPEPDRTDNTSEKCCDNDKQEPPTEAVCSNDNLRPARSIEIQFDICNPVTCCKKDISDEDNLIYNSETKDCKEDERKSTKLEKVYEKCNTSKLFCCDKVEDIYFAPIENTENCTKNNFRPSSDIEREAKVCNPVVCCSGTTIIYQEDGDCQPPLTSATDEQITAGSCGSSEPNEAETEAGTACSSGSCSQDDSSPSSSQTTEELEQELSNIREQLEESKRATEEAIERLKDQREESDREYGERRKERDKDTALAEDLSDCQNRSGNWSELSSANQKICGLLARIHQRQDEMAKMQDYNQQVQQQLWQAVQNQSMNAFSQYESIHKMMKPGFFNSPYPGQNLQMMNQINSMKQQISTLTNSMDQQALTSRFDQLVSRMDQMIQLNATGVYNNDAYYRNFRQDLLGVQQVLPQNQRPILR